MSNFKRKSFESLSFRQMPTLRGRPSPEASVEHNYLRTGGFRGPQLLLSRSATSQTNELPMCPCADDAGDPLKSWMSNTYTASVCEQHLRCECVCVCVCRWSLEWADPHLSVSQSLCWAAVQADANGLFLSLSAHELSSAHSVVTHVISGRLWRAVIADFIRSAQLPTPAL